MLRNKTYFLFYFLSRYQMYMKSLSREQLDKLQSIKNMKKQQKEQKLLRKDLRFKKEELEKLGKPKKPENAFLLFCRTFQRGNENPQVCTCCCSTLFHRVTLACLFLYFFFF